MREWIVEYVEFVRENRAYWMVPLLLVLGLVGALVVFAKGSAVAPFIYTFF